jgi:hypothetical protein
MKYIEAKEKLGKGELQCPRCWTTSDRDLSICDEDNEEVSIFCHNCWDYVI